MGFILNTDGLYLHLKHFSLWSYFKGRCIVKPQSYFKPNHPLEEDENTRHPAVEKFKTA